MRKRIIMNEKKIHYLLIMFVVILLVELFITTTEFPQTDPIIIVNTLIGIYWIKWILVIVILFMMYYFITERRDLDSKT